MDKFNAMYQAATELPNGALRNELLALFAQIEEAPVAEQAGRFDANMADCSQAANAWYVATMNA